MVVVIGHAIGDDERVFPQHVLRHMNVYVCVYMCMYVYMYGSWKGHIWVIERADIVSMVIMAMLWY